MVCSQFVVLVCIAVAAEAPQRQVASKAPSSPQDVEILRYDTDNDGLVSYRFTALKRGIKLGLLQMEHGRYRLNEMCRIGRHVAARKIRLRQRTKQRTLRMHSGTPSRKFNY